MSNINYRLAHLTAADRALIQGQYQPQQAGFNATLQNSRSTAHQSQQVYQVQSQPQSQYYRPTGPPDFRSTIPRDINSNNILDHFLSQIRDHQQHVNYSLAKSDKCLEALLSSVSSIRETVDGLKNKLEAHDHVFEKLERSGLDDNRMRAKEIDVMKVLVGEMKSFKKSLGKSCDGDDGRTVLGRLDAVTFAVGELLERARDPEANLSEPGTSITVVPPIDLTSSGPSPPPWHSTPPLQSLTYVDVGTSPVPSPPPLKEKYFASIQVDTSPRPRSTPFFQPPVESITYSGRFSPTHTLVDNTTAGPDIGFVALSQERLESAAPAPKNVDLVVPTNSTPDSQASTLASTIDVNYSEDITGIRTKSSLSVTTPATMEKEPRAENSTVHPVMHSDLASSESVQPPQNITGSDEPMHTDYRPMEHDAGLLKVAPGPKSDTPSFELPYSAATPTNAAFPPDNMDSERLTVDTDKNSHNEEKISASKRDKEKGEDEKEVEKWDFELDRNHDGDLPIPSPGLIDLSQHLYHPRSSSCFASSSTSLISLSTGGIAGSTPDVNISRSTSLFPRSPNIKSYSPTRTKVLVGANRSPGSAFHAPSAPPSVPSGAISISTSNSTIIPLTPIRKAAFAVSLQPVSQPTTTNAGLVTATPTNIIASPAIETSLLRDWSPLSDLHSDVETDKSMTKDTDEQIVDDLLNKREISPGENADIIRVKKRRISEGPSTVKRGLSLEKESPVVKGKPSLLSLKAGKKGESAAITRVKKRKVTSNVVIDEVEGKRDYGDGLDQERPLKRARQRVSERQMKMDSLEKGKRLRKEPSESSLGTESSTRLVKSRSVVFESGIVATRLKKPSPSASAPANVRKSNSPLRGRSSGRGHRKVEVEWPELTQGDQSEDLLECNGCKAWYHYRCVGIAPGDPRLHNENEYFCPPCEVGIVITKLSKDTHCWRPGCVAEDGYIVEKIIGRFKTVVDGQGVQFKYLLRWKGYKLSESTWEPEESMYDPPFMIDKFRIDALEEGIDIDKDKTGLVLLRVARHPCVPKPT